MKKITIILATRKEAEEIFDKLLNIINRYGNVSVHDLYGITGVMRHFPDSKYGWTNTNNMSIKRIPEGYLLDLPDPVFLDGAATATIVFDEFATLKKEI